MKLLNHFLVLTVFCLFMACEKENLVTQEETIPATQHQPGSIPPIDTDIWTQDKDGQWVSEGEWTEELFNNLAFTAEDRTKIQDIEQQIQDDLALGSEQIVNEPIEKNCSLMYGSGFPSTENVVEYDPLFRSDFTRLSGHGQWMPCGRNRNRNANNNTYYDFSHAVDNAPSFGRFRASYEPNSYLDSSCRGSSNLAGPQIMDMRIYQWTGSNWIQIYYQRSRTDRPFQGVRQSFVVPATGWYYAYIGKTAFDNGWLPWVNVRAMVYIPRC